MKRKICNIIDQDDLVEKEYIKTMDNKINENDVDVVISNQIEFINNEKINEKRLQFYKNHIDYNRRI